MGLFVKICGCCSGSDVEAVAELRPDALGFIQWPGSKRYVHPAEVGQWLKAVPSDILKVGVFVDASADEIRQAVEVAGFDIVQLHGQESPEQVAAIEGRRWKVVHLNKPISYEFSAYAVDAFLLDYHAGHLPGGTGVALDWQRAAQWVANSSKPVMLAGGLRPSNIAEAIRIVKPWGVDVSSGVEQAVGRKDLIKVKDFIQTCRSAH
jgi:phosphoribosylanthranilate isomerase